MAWKPGMAGAGRRGRRGAEQSREEGEKRLAGGPGEEILFSSFFSFLWAVTQGGHDLAGISKILRMPASLCTGELEIVYGRGKVLNYP